MRVSARNRLRLPSGDSAEQPHTSLADRAYKELERLILTAKLAPGQWITEVGISERLNISRTPVREALQRLVIARLVEAVPRRGLRITEINVRDQLLLLELRREIERYVTTRVARRCSQEDRRRLSDLAEAMSRNAEAEDEAGHYAIDLEFKLLLLRCVDNQYAADAITPLWAVSRRFAWVNRSSRNVPFIARLTAALMRAIASGERREVVKATDAFISGLVTLARATLEE